MPPIHTIPIKSRRSEKGDMLKDLALRENETKTRISDFPALVSSKAEKRLRMCVDLRQKTQAHAVENKNFNQHFEK